MMLGVLVLLALVLLVMYEISQEDKKAEKCRKKHEEMRKDAQGCYELVECEELYPNTIQAKKSVRSIVGENQHRSQITGNKNEIELVANKTSHVTNI